MIGKFGVFTVSLKEEGRRIKGSTVNARKKGPTTEERQRRKKQGEEKEERG